MELIESIEEMHKWTLISNDPIHIKHFSGPKM